jgi:hypothetical protein
MYARAYFQNVYFFKYRLFKNMRAIHGNHGYLIFLKIVVKLNCF